MGCLLKAGGGLHARLVVGAVLLAAGEAKRFGGKAKPLLQLGGVPLIRRNLIALSGAGVDEVAVVLGHCADEIEVAVRDFPVTIVRNNDYAHGQMSSVRAGLAALSGKVDAIVIAPADQPMINMQDITELIGAFKKCRAQAMSGASEIASAVAPASIIVPYVNGERGNPIVLDASVREEILAGGMDFGCRQWIAQHPEQVARFETGNQHFLVDVDTPEDLERFKARYGHTLQFAAESAIS